MPVDFRNVQVATFESRLDVELSDMVTSYGGRPLSAPTTRAVPLESTDAACDLARRCIEGHLDFLILLTGVGTRMLLETVRRQRQAGPFIESLRRLITIARGPKPVEALRTIGIEPTMTVREPSTCHDLLADLDERDPLDSRRVAVLEPGRRPQTLIEALESRGARVLSVPIYQWQLPEDLTSIRGSIAQMIEGQVAFALFTNSTQVRHLFQVAARYDGQEQLQEALKRIGIGSIGPVATQTLREHSVTADLEPDRPRMHDLVRALARRGHDLRAKKHIALEAAIDTNRWKRIDMVWSGATGTLARPTIDDSPFMKACRRQQVPYTPIWLMRQAGRFQRSYRAIKAKMSMLELCKTPALTAELTLNSVDQFGFDAAIIFADLLPVVEPMGLRLSYVKGVGPVIENPIRTPDDIRSLRQPPVGELDYVFEAIKITRRALRPDVALIGFAGAPFTLASYMIEGGKSTTFSTTKSMMYREPAAWHMLMTHLTDLLIKYLNRQIEAGANALQLFDSWVGCLGPHDYQTYVQPHVKRLVAHLDGTAPLIHFATGNPALLPLLRAAGGDVMGLDWRVDLAEAWATLGDQTAVMGNLEPAVLLGPVSEIRRRAKSILDKAAGRPGHIFNLGHGIFPNVPCEHVSELVEAVHELSQR